MGKIYASVCGVTHLETRQKKDGSGSYEFAAIDLQVYDNQNVPSTHEIFDWKTGVSKGKYPDAFRYDAIRDKAMELDAQNYHVGDVVVADISINHNQYGRNEITVNSVERYQQPAQPQFAR